MVFANGLAKRTAASEYPVKGRATLGVKVAAISERGGDLVGALTVDEGDEVMVVMEKGKIVRSRVAEVRRTGRSTQGVQFATPDKGDAIVAVARNVESDEVDEEVVGSTEPGADDSAAATTEALPTETAADETSDAVTDRSTDDATGDAQVKSSDDASETPTDEPGGQE